MFLSRQPTNIMLVSGTIILVWIISMQWETVSTAENYSENEITNRTKHVNLTQSLIESQSTKKQTTNRTTTKASTKKPPTTTPAIQFLDDNEALPGEPYDDDDVTLDLLSTKVSTTTVKIPIQKTEEVNALLSRAQRPLEPKHPVSEWYGTTGSNINVKSSTSKNRTKDAESSIKPFRKRHIRATGNDTGIVINPTSTKLETKYATTEMPTSTATQIDETFRTSKPIKQEGQFSDYSLDTIINNSTAGNENGFGVMSLQVADAIGRPDQQAFNLQQLTEGGSGEITETYQSTITSATFTISATGITATETYEGSGEVTEESTIITIPITDITYAKEETTTIAEPTIDIATTEKETTTITLRTTSVSVTTIGTQDLITTTIPTTYEGSGEVSEESTIITIPTADITIAKAATTTITEPITDITTTEEGKTTTTLPTTSVITTETQELTTSTKPTTNFTTTGKQELATTAIPTTNFTTTGKQELATTAIPTTSITTAETQELATTAIPTTSITTAETQELATTTKPITSFTTTETQELTSITTPITSTTVTPTQELTTTSTTRTSTTSTTTTRTPPRTSASTAASSRSTSTIARTTTPPRIEQTKPPKYDDVKSNLSMTFDITIEIVFDIRLEDTSSDAFKNMARDVEISINIAFFYCPGFIRGSAKVKAFIRVAARFASERFSLDGPLPLADDGDQTQADYDVSFEKAAVISDPVTVTNYITQTVAPNLQSSGVGNFSVNTDSMERAANDQVANVTRDICNVALCDPCYHCQEVDLDNSTAKTANCIYDCNLSNQRCTIVDNTRTVAIGSCTCMKGYLTVGSRCTDENVAIGVTVAIASVLFLGFLVAVIVLGYRAVHATKKLKDSKSGFTSSNVDEPVKRTKNQDIADQSIANDLDDLNSQSITTHEGESDEDVDADYDYDDDVDLPAAISQPEVYDTFVPNLTNVSSEDLTKKYSIVRPRISPISVDIDMGIYHYASYF